MNESEKGVCPLTVCEGSNMVTIFLCYCFVNYALAHVILWSGSSQCAAKVTGVWEQCETGNDYESGVEHRKEMMQYSR